MQGFIMAKKRAPDKFPLTKQQNGQYSKKFRGKVYYFGTDRDSALKRFATEWADIKAGRDEKPAAGGLKVADLANHFLIAKKERMHSGELSARLWADYHRTCEIVVKGFGRDRKVADLRTDD